MQRHVDPEEPDPMEARREVVGLLSIASGRPSAQHPTRFDRLFASAPPEMVHRDAAPSVDAARLASTPSAIHADLSDDGDRLRLWFAESPLLAFRCHQSVRSSEMMPLTTSPTSPVALR